MKFITTFFSIGLILGCNTSLAAGAGEASGADPSNPFSGAIIIGLAGAHITLSAIPGEDVSSPFNEAHPVEQGIYERLYYRHYHGPSFEVNPPPQEMPSAFDAKGRPLWFDGLGRSALLSLVMALFGKEQSDDLDHLFDDWNNLSDRTADGGSKLETFQEAMNYFFSTSNAWDSDYQRIRRWREKTPESRAAALTEALYWYKYAWRARGNGYASSVTPEGWKLLRKRLEKAEAVLLESKEYASSSPLWWDICLQVGSGLGWPKQRLLEIFSEATKKEKYFYTSYINMAYYLDPKWGGSWQLVDTFIKDAVKNTQTVEGYSMYARLYWNISALEGVDFNLFRESLASWPEMKRGFEDIVRRYPHSAWHINNFAAFACMAGDKETFQNLRFRIAKTVIPRAWPSNYSLDVCEQKFETQN